ncbi:hypothetical protein ACN47E_008111 [Coniothyrium glycines]
MRKRYRACEECHRLKIKCDINVSSSCERCIRNGLRCVPAAPRLQRDRISELEGQVQELQNALQAQSRSTKSNTSAGGIAEHTSLSILPFIDLRMLIDRQNALLQAFEYQARSSWPFIYISTSLDLLRADSPILLLSLLAHAVTQKSQGISVLMHDDLVRETMQVLGRRIVGEGQRSLELVQALLVAAFWSKHILGEEQASCYQLVQLAADMAIDVGIAGFAWQPSPAAYFSRHDEVTSLQARYTWLACYVALSTSSISLRRPHSAPWGSYHRDCLFHIERRGRPPDILLGQIPEVFIQCDDHSTHIIMEAMKNKVDEWVAQIPPSLASLLHTRSNKVSFAAPYIPGRIPIRDFPRPTTLSPLLKTALLALIHNCQAAIKIATEMDPELVLSLPTFCFAPTVLYALFVLVTALVTATDPSNTYGCLLTKHEFSIEECGVKLRALTNCMKVLDPTMSCYTTRLFDATEWLEEWYNNYAVILQRYNTTIATSSKPK